MKYYETHYEDYINSVEKYNLHPELSRIHNKFPKKISQLENLIVYGPTGTGKYSQVLYLLKKYSPSDLKYDKKITIQTEKQQYIYRISDIHYEIDMSLLGCNSKLLWHEIFFQIVDIISVKSEKIGILLCKNFHLIHGELLEIFYSYMQQYNHSQSTIKIRFIIISEHISFLPMQIVNSCQIINISRPTKDKYFQMLSFSRFPELKQELSEESKNFIKKISHYKSNVINVEKTKNIMDNIQAEGIINIKELNFFSNLNDIIDIPNDAFNIICDNIIEEIIKKDKIIFTNFRDTLYDILTYNLDVAECLLYILNYFIQNEFLNKSDISDILKKTHSFLKYYNNNYRPIYHLESIFFYIINKIHKYK
jgi:Cdc6-like AAA superfamily ATPase